MPVAQAIGTTAPVPMCTNLRLHSRCPFQRRRTCSAASANRASQPATAATPSSCCDHPAAMGSSGLLVVAHQAQLHDRFCLQLPHPLPRHIDQPANLREGERFGPFQAEAQLEDLLFPVV